MNSITLPGIGGSDDTHWQTLWEQQQPGISRFAPTDWDRPDLEDWITALDRSVSASPSPPILIAHSLACLLVAHWQARSTREVAGAFLVAVPDPTRDAFPREAASFAPVPDSPLRFPSLIVASSNDPYGSPAYAMGRAASWGSGIVNVGPCGHINGKSGLGAWPEGMALLHAFRAGAADPETRRIPA